MQTSAIHWNDVDGARFADGPAALRELAEGTQPRPVAV
jgi:hypothetical protein